MDNFIVEKGKLGGKYKRLGDFKPRDERAAWAMYYKTPLEAGEQKRILQGKRKLRHLPCYYT